MRNWLLKTRWLQIALGLALLVWGYGMFEWPWLFLPPLENIFALNAIRTIVPIAGLVLVLAPLTFARLYDSSGVYGRLDQRRARVARAQKNTEEDTP